MVTRFTNCILLFYFILLAGCSKTDMGSQPLFRYSENLKDPGESSKDLLTATKYTAVAIEIQYMPGYVPNIDAINNLVDFMNLLINKPGGITVVMKEVPSDNRIVYTLDHVIAFEKANRTVYTNGNTIGIYILYTDGYYADNRALGFSYLNTSICVCGRKLFENSGAVNQPSRVKLESTIVEHETAHLLGLVNLGASLQSLHEDPVSKSHCTNPDCLMYYYVQTDIIQGPLILGNVPALDAKCRADLKANGGK